MLASASSLDMADCASFLLRMPTTRFLFLLPRFPLHSRKLGFPTSRRLQFHFSASARTFQIACAGNGRQQSGNKPGCQTRSGKSRSDSLLQNDTHLDKAEYSEAVIKDSNGIKQAIRWRLDMFAMALFGVPFLMSFTDAAHAESSGDLDLIYADISAGIESGAQLLYLGALLGLVGIASFFVVRQILIRRELESAAKVLQERVRTGEALPVEYFELGAVMLRKRFFGLAAKYLEQAIDKWDGDPQDLAQVHNALGFSFISDDKVDKGIVQYEKAVKLQPGYVVAWNNLGNAYQKKKELPKALKAYEQALFFDPNNKIARDFRDTLKERVDRLAGVSVKSD